MKSKRKLIITVLQHHDHQCCVFARLTEKWPRLQGEKSPPLRLPCTARRSSASQTTMTSVAL
eukprot:3900830-Rhodomonas_salina.1